MKENPLISVIVPVYNTPRNLLDKCIESLVQQTLDNIEIILVDDKSTDDSLEYLRGIEQKYINVTVISHKENKRQGGARNTGIKAAKADLIGFCDSDDFVELKMYEKLYDKMASLPDLDCVHCFLDRYEEGKGFRSEPDQYRRESLSIDGINLNPENRDILLLSGGGVVTYLLRRDLFINNDLWFPENTAYEDNYLWPILLMTIKKIGIVDEDLYHYYVNTQSTTHNPKLLYERIKVEDNKLEELKKRGMFDYYHKYIEYSYWALAYRNTIRMTLWFDMSLIDSYRIFRLQRQKLLKIFPAYRHNQYVKDEFTRFNNLVGDGFVAFVIYRCFMSLTKLRRLCLTLLRSKD